MNKLLEKIDDIFIKKEVSDRIKFNLSLNVDILYYCKSLIYKNTALIDWDYKNWYVMENNTIFVIDFNTYEIKSAFKTDYKSFKKKK